MSSLVSISRDTGHITKGNIKFGYINNTLLGFRFWAVVVTNVLFWNAQIYKDTASFLL
jgi:hypothetical protein